MLALGSLLFRPAYPYGFTLPVALTQDWEPRRTSPCWPRLGLARSAAAPAGAGRAVASFLAFLAYAFLTPPWAQQWERPSRNEPKTLRMAVALGHWWISLDVEGVSAPMGSAWRRARCIATRAAASTRRVETAGMGALLHGPSAVGREAIEATRIASVTIRGKDGGCTTCWRPGRRCSLAPWLRVDRWLNQRAGTPGRLTVTVLSGTRWPASLVGAALPAPARRH